MSNSHGYILKLLTTNRSYFSQHGVHAEELLDTTWTVTTVADMDAGDTANVQFKPLSGAGNTSDVQEGTSTVLQTYFSGYLLG